MEQGVWQGGEDVVMLQMGRCGGEDGRYRMIQDDTLEMDDRSLGLFQLLIAVSHGGHTQPNPPDRTEK
jgi:hypothetical protein